METTNEVKKTRVRTKFDTSELYHVWANQGQESGKHKGGRLSFDGPWLMYDRRRLAWVDGEKKVALINGERFSSSGWGGAPENNHTYGAKSAVTGLYKEVCTVPLQFLRWVNDKNCKPGGYSWEYGAPYTAEDWFTWALGGVLKARLVIDKKVKEARARRYYYMWYGLENEYESRSQVMRALYAMELIDNGKVELFRDVEARVAYTEEELNAAKEWSDKWKKVDEERVRNHGAFGRKSWQRRQQEREEREKQRLIKLVVTEERWEELCKVREAAVKEWKERTDNRAANLPGGLYSNDRGRYVVKVEGQAATSNDWREFPKLEHHERTILAVRNSEGTPSGHEPYVLTSRGAQVPIGQAVRLLRLVEVMRMRGEDYVVSREDGGKHQFGYYTLTSVSKDGDVRIGCHEITWPVIEEFRPRLMEYWGKWKESKKESEQGVESNKEVEA